MAPGTGLCSPMLLIAAALEEELDTAKALCRNARKVEGLPLDVWEADCRGEPLRFLKTGVGPKRSAERLARALQFFRPASVLVTGYAGALDPDLRLGSLVAVTKALLCSLPEGNPGWENAALQGSYDLAVGEALKKAAAAAGLELAVGDVLTSPHVLGDPAHKRLLHERFQASIVDMETAALARVAQSANLPLACVRAVSDVAEDEFLVPFSHDPSLSLPARAARLIGSGVVSAFRAWKDRAAVAGASLGRFFAEYLASH